MLTSRRIRLIAGALTVLVTTGLVLALVGLGPRPLARGFVLHVDFGQLDQLREGDQVRISALRAGRVIAIRHLRQARLRRVRVDLWLEQTVAPLVRSNSLCYVNAKGFIGERHLEIGPPAPNAPPGPPVVPGQVLRGLDSPRLDRLLQAGYDSLRALEDLARGLEPELQALSAARTQLAQTLHVIAPSASEGRMLARLIQSLHPLADARRAILRPLERGYRLISALGAVRDSIAREGPALAAERDRLRAAFVELGELGTAPQQIQLAGAKLQAAVRPAMELLAMLHELMARVSEGKGTVGRVLHDPRLRDDLKGLHRLLNEQLPRVRRRPRGPR